MNTTILAAVLDTEARLEGWFWLIVLVALLVVMLLALALLRRRLLRPMPHEPSDTTDAWVEAGRRLHPPPSDGQARTPPSGEGP